MAAASGVTKGWKKVNCSDLYNFVKLDKVRVLLLAEVSTWLVHEGVVNDFDSTPQPNLVALVRIFHKPVHSNTT